MEWNAEGWNEFLRLKRSAGQPWQVGVDGPRWNKTVVLTGEGDALLARKVDLGESDKYEMMEAGARSVEEADGAGESPMPETDDDAPACSDTLAPPLSSTCRRPRYEPPPADSAGPASSVSGMDGAVPGRLTPGIWVGAAGGGVKGLVSVLWVERGGGAGEVCRAGASRGNASFGGRPPGGVGVLRFVRLPEGGGGDLVRGRRATSASASVEKGWSRLATGPGRRAENWRARSRKATNLCSYRPSISSSSSTARAGSIEVVDSDVNKDEEEDWEMS
ncbi:hypothetical protein QBC39DRAFT_332966 [Podospora conica]|nr:hypothetical protein QBC39DRAFT_332966 [Schizothecium conicum]